MVLLGLPRGLPDRATYGALPPIFLELRTQQVSLCYCSPAVAKPGHVAVGVPQDSILGILLFFMHQLLLAS